MLNSNSAGNGMKECYDRKYHKYSSSRLQPAAGHVSPQLLSLTNTPSDPAMTIERKNWG